MSDLLTPFDELKSAMFPELWRAWKIFGAGCGVYLVLIKPLFPFSSVSNLVQAWIDSLAPTCIILLLNTLFFGLWSVFSLSMINNLVLKRYPADAPFEQLSAPLERVRLLITFAGLGVVFPAVALDLLTPLKGFAQDTFVITASLYYWYGRVMAEHVKAQHTAPQSA